MAGRRNSILAGLLLATVATTGACVPSAKVRRTTPVANLQSYRNVLVRVAAAPNANQHVAQLEFQTSDAMRQSCSFGRVMGATEQGQIKPDLIVDLNIRRTARGGGGFIKNPNLATVDVTMVLSDGLDESLLGSADIQGRSSAVLVQGENPEDQAISAVAKRIAAIMGNSGCKGERIARAEDPAPANPGQSDPGTTDPANPDPGTPAPGTPDPATPAADPEAIAKAEAANDEGKRLFRAADIAAAKAQFEQAISFHDDPRFQFNLCLAHEALGELKQADAACPPRRQGQATPRDHRVEAKRLEGIPSVPRRQLFE
jgi:hypothetical protein